MSVITRTGRPAAAIALVLALAACGGDDAGTGTDSPVVEPTSEPSMDPSMPGMDMGS